MATTAIARHDVRDLGLAGRGRLRIEWAESEMPVLRQIRERFATEKPLKGVRIAACLHVTTETANLMITLAAGGAEVWVCASNPLSTQDDVAAALVAQHAMGVYSIKGEDEGTYYRHIRAVLDARPTFTMDDGADLVSVLHKGEAGDISRVIGGTEETTTGVVRLRSMEKHKVLKYPIVAVNEAMTKHFFDNRYGTGQSALDGVIRATNVLIAGRTVVVGGYGWCGRGVAARARGHGAQVIITEIDPMRALEAVMDGFRVMPMAKAAREGDIFISVTGGYNVIDRRHIEKMKDGAILSNAGHFNDEINIPALVELSGGKRRKVRDFVEEFTLVDGRRINLLADGRLVNLAAAEGHPASVMDMSFANQALAAEWVLKNAAKLKPKVYNVPEDMDREIARLKLKAMGVEVDRLSREQRVYASSWQSGT
ncbi:MAG: adenosylhomocysteinase [Chloroflexota bacterium]|nr:MAG: adenosylhomocysteinase [Chloroflexota bacterium]